MSDSNNKVLVIGIGCTFGFVFLVIIIIVILMRKKVICSKKKEKTVKKENEQNSNSIDDIQEEDIEVYLSSASKNKTTSNNETIKFEFGHSKTENKNDIYTLRRPKKSPSHKNNKNCYKKCETFNYSSSERTELTKSTSKNNSITTSHNNINCIPNINSNPKTEPNKINKEQKTKDKKRPTIISTNTIVIDVPEEHIPPKHLKTEVVNEIGNKAKKTLFNRLKKTKKIILNDHQKSNSKKRNKSPIVKKEN